ncbi:hypothetical protein BG003_008051, partial [Podila horticola]
MSRLSIRGRCAHSYSRNNTPTPSPLSLTFSSTSFLLFLVFLLSTHIHRADASLFGNDGARLNYDRVSVKSKPTSVHDAEIIAPGKALAAGVIEATGTLPKQGVAGILYDLGYACTSSNYSTIPTPEFYGLPKIALIQRGGPPGSSACTFRVKLQLAIDQGAVGALVFNNANDTALDGATAALSETEKSPLDFPAVLIAYEDGVTLKTYLEQTKDISGTDFYNRVRVNMVLDRRIPVVW